MEKKLLHKHISNTAVPVLEHNKYVKNTYYVNDVVDLIYEDAQDIYNALGFILDDELMDETKVFYKKGYIKKLKKLREALRTFVFIDVKDFNDGSES